MRIAQEEIFGPVACLIPFTDEADAIAQANDIPYGLSSYVWSREPRPRAPRGRGHRGRHVLRQQPERARPAPALRRHQGSGTGREGGTWSYEVFLEPKNVAVSLGSHHIPHWGV